jgi:predicted nuclease with TOPRIM domain
MSRRRFTRAEQPMIDALVERRLIRERDAHRAERVRLRRSVDEVLAINVVLNDALDRLESENADLRQRLSELRTFQQIAQWRRNRIVSWRGWFRTATND